MHHKLASHGDDLDPNPQAVPEWGEWRHLLVHGSGEISSCGYIIKGMRFDSEYIEMLETQIKAVHEKLQAAWNKLNEADVSPDH